MKLINIGFGNVVIADKIVSVVSPDSAPIKRLVQEQREEGNIVDATYGRKTRAVIVMDSHHIVLSSVLPETIVARLENGL